jgi:hypothetical protein
MKFTYDSYRILLKKLKEDYEFISFSRAKYSRHKESEYNKLILRHDIDQSLDKAKIMSEIEADLGISSTYFLFLKSPFYNMFSYNGEECIRSIISNNHYIGLHFDYSKYSFHTVSQLTYQIKKEAEFLQSYFGVKVDSISFHRPLDVDFFNKLELSLYPHAYEDIFMDDYKYFSDSRGSWRFGNPLESIEYQEKKNLHLLIHPIWWNEESNTAIESLNNFKNDYMSAFEKSIYQELKGFWDSLETDDK